MDIELDIGVRKKIDSSNKPFCRGFVDSVFTDLLEIERLLVVVPKAPTCSATFYYFEGSLGQAVCHTRFDK
jgi:hypothetical protein